MFCKNCGNKLQETMKFCTNCGYGVESISKTKIATPGFQIKKFFKNPLIKLKQNSNTLKRIGIVALILGVLVVLILRDENKDKALKANHNIISRSVVNILCDNGQGGSGTIFTTDGLVLTNSHVIIGSTVCQVTIPNFITGGIEEVYEAIPEVISKLGENFDVATLKIISPFTDADGKIRGKYPLVFSPFVISKNCDVNDPSKLGDSIRIYGYPVTSGGFNLTITEGIISSFTNEGEILTSAQIDSGNSGGLAVDQNGCWLGIPSAVVSGNYQNLGVIIPGNIVQIFLPNVPAKLNPSKENTNSVTQSAIYPGETNEVRCQTEFGANSTWSGEMDATGSPTCMCQKDYSWSSTGESCTPDSALQKECKDRFGPQAYSLENEEGKAVCDCKTGYKFNSTDTACVAISASATVPGINYQYTPVANAPSGCASSTGYSATTGLSCSGDGSCADGSWFDSNAGLCQDASSSTTDWSCNQKYNNSQSEFDSTTGEYSCGCKEGYYWDNNASGQDGNCFTPKELNQACHSSHSGSYWSGEYTNEGIYNCVY